MELPITYMTLIESYIVGTLLGASTLAVIAYGISLRYGYPREGIGNALIQSIYTVIRLFHIFFAILVTLYIIIFGIMDGIPEVWYEYGIKAAVLIVNAVVAFGMARSRSLFPVDYFAPVLGAGWYFLASYHSYSLHIQATAIVGPIIAYIAFLSIFQVVFLALRYLVPTKNTQPSDKTAAGRATM